MLRWNSQFSVRAPVRVRTRSSFVASLAHGSFSTVASQRWPRFLCGEKGSLPESIVKRVPIIRQLVVWLTEAVWAGNSQSSLFLEEKLSSPETWIHWKPRLNKVALRARMAVPKPVSVVPSSICRLWDPKQHINQSCFFLRLGTSLNQ